MNAINVLESGHQTVLQAIDSITGIDWERPGISGAWSVKDVLAHLTAYEHVLIDALYTLRGGKTTPSLDRWLKDTGAFNQHEVNLRRCDSIHDILSEYQEAYNEAISQIVHVPQEKLRQSGTLPWYGAEYDAEDFITYISYGHKREHAAQIMAYCDLLHKEPVWKIREAS
jgi:uncharacterized damage-inducible protein DinB